jgi:SAM-dependent methyltransferase
MASLVGYHLTMTAVEVSKANHRFLLQWLERQPQPLACLDFGCGFGEVVLAGRERGMRVFGADVFSERGDGAAIVSRLQDQGLFGDAIQEIRDGRLPFADSSFDVVIANQVFEHIRQFSPAIDEIARVLIPGGRLLAMFPSKAVIREGHIGIPMVHWLPPGRVQYAYALAMRRMGFGDDAWGNGGLPPREWTAVTLHWLATRTFYKTKREALRSFRARFSISFAEEDLIAYRLGPRFDRIVRLPIIREAGRFAVRRLAGMVLLCVKN